MMESYQTFPMLAIPVSKAQAKPDQRRRENGGNHSHNRALFNVVAPINIVLEASMRDTWKIFKTINYPPVIPE
jgi:hypothetical protein